MNKTPQWPSDVDPRCISSYIFCFTLIDICKIPIYICTSFHLQAHNRSQAPWGQWLCSVCCCIPSDKDSAWLREGFNRYLLNASICPYTAFVFVLSTMIIALLCISSWRLLAGSLSSSASKSPVVFTELKFKIASNSFWQWSREARNVLPLAGRFDWKQRASVTS